MKDKILKMLKAKEEARDALVAQSEKSENVEELRSINKQLEIMKQEIRELQAMAEEAEGEGRQKTPEELEAEARTKAVQEEAAKRAKAKAEGRQYIPGKGFQATPEGTQQPEDRKKEQQAKEERGKALKEGRAVTVGTSSIVLPQSTATTIQGTFQQVSSLIDGVDQLPINGGESYKQPYEISTPDGNYTGEGEAPADTDTKFGFAQIGKAKVTSYSELTEEITKLAAAPYEDVVMTGITRSVRKKLAKEIMIGDGATDHLAGIFSTAADAIDATTDMSISEIDNTTLDSIVYGYGGSEAVEGQAALILNKKDLSAFAKLRSADGKKFHTIILGSTSGGYGTIDGIPFIVNSACYAVSDSNTASGKYCMAFGDLKNYRMTIFSDLEVQLSKDYKFKEGMIAHRGVAFIGGNVVAQNGFLRVKKS